MHKINQVAPFFNLTSEELKEILKEIDLVFPLERTRMGVYKVRNSDLAIIELYINLKKLFVKHEVTLNYFKEVLEERGLYESESEWLAEIKKRNGY